MDASEISPARHEFQPERSVRWRGVLIISIPALCLFTAIFAITILRAKTIAVQQQEQNSRQTLIDTERLMRTLVDAETGVRGYLVTRRPEFLEPYLTSKTFLPQVLDSLKVKVKTHRIPPEHFDRISTLVQQEFTQLEQILKTSQAQGAVRSDSSLITDELLQSKLNMDYLRQEIAEFAIQEERWQRDREARALQWQQWTTAVQWVALALGLVGSVAALYLFSQLEQELAERASRLRETNLYLRAVFDNVVDGIIILNERGYIQSANVATAQIFGYQPDEVTGKHLQQLIAESFTDDSGRIMASLVGKNQNKLRLQQETVGRHKQGKTFPMEFAISGMHLDNQHLFIAIVRDITKRKQSEMALRESEELYRTLVKNFPNGAVFLFDRELRYKIAEGIALGTLNLNSEMLTGKTIWETLPSETAQILEPIYHAALAGITTVAEVPFADRLYCVHVLPLSNADGEVFSGLTMTQDITESKKAEEALRSRADELARMTSILAQTTTSLEKRNAELDQFAYLVSHDLKAPLRAISNLSQWLEDDLQNCLTEDTRHQMNLLRGRVHRMEALIDGLLKYSRIGRLSSEFEVVDVEALLAEVIDSLSPPPNFTVQVEPGMPTFLTQRLPLAQVFANLISNGIKHHHQTHGKIAISVTDYEDFYEFSVADNGPGIAPEFHEKVFIMFQTLEPRDRVENTGVGLAIVKKILDEQGGKISLESQLGNGSIFRFSWPKEPKG